MSDLLHKAADPPKEDAAEEIARITATVPAVVREAQEAFRGALPQLLRERPGQWVAYQASQQLGFAPTKAELYQRCLRQGYARGEFIVRRIRPCPAEGSLIGPFEIG